MPVRHMRQAHDKKKGAQKSKVVCIYGDFSYDIEQFLHNHVKNVGRFVFNKGLIK